MSELKPAHTSLPTYPDISADKLLNTFLDMVQISSPSGDEEELREWIQARLDGIGLQHQYVVDQTGNILINIPSNTAFSATILMTAHMDVVPPCIGVKPIVEGEGLNRVIRSSGDTVLGGDDKAALSSLLEALELNIKYDSPRPNLLILFTVKEEIGALGAVEIEPQIYQHVDLAIALDSNEPIEHVIYSSPQLTLFDITVHGHSAHSGFEPQKGANALQALATAVSKFRLGQIDTDTTANVGTFQSGKNSILSPILRSPTVRFVHSQNRESMLKSIP